MYILFAGLLAARLVTGRSAILCEWNRDPLLPNLFSALTGSRYIIDTSHRADPSIPQEVIMSLTQSSDSMIPDVIFDPIMSANYNSVFTRVNREFVFRPYWSANIGSTMDEVPPTGLVLEYELPADSVQSFCADNIMTYVDGVIGDEWMLRVHVQVVSEDGNILDGDVFLDVQSSMVHQNALRRSPDLYRISSGSKFDTIADPSVVAKLIRTIHSTGAVILPRIPGDRRISFGRCREHILSFPFLKYTIYGGESGNTPRAPALEIILTPDDYINYFDLNEESCFINIMSAEDDERLPTHSATSTPRPTTFSNIDRSPLFRLTFRDNEEIAQPINGYDWSPDDDEPWDVVQIHPASTQTTGELGLGIFKQVVVHFDSIQRRVGFCDPPYREG